jgi:hypothetical protein
MADDGKIPRDVAKELRALAHDLSNALETILQATYLVSKSELPEQSRRWIETIDHASQEAARINRVLRETLRTRS